MRPQPAPVLGDHAVGFQDLPAFRAAFQPVVGKHDIQRIVHRRQSGVEPLQLQRRVFGHDIDDARPVPMQDRFAGRRTAMELQPGQPQGQQGDAVGLAQFVPADQLAGPDHFGHDHGDGLERLDLFVGIVALRPVLNRQHADDAAVAQHRHAHHRMVDFLAGFRPVGEAGMGLRVGQGDRPGARRNVADHALADAQARLVNGRLVQAFGGVEFQDIAGAPQIERTHFGDHIGRDQRDDPVEPGLDRNGLRPGHRIADPPQQPPDIRQPAGRQPRRRTHAVGRSGQFGHGGPVPLLLRPVPDASAAPEAGWVGWGGPTGSILRPGRKPYAARAAPVRYIPRRSGHSP